MQFTYQSVPLIGPTPPSLPPGTRARLRPLIPVTIFDPTETFSRDFSRALLDTGADETVFPADLIADLGLTPIGSLGQRLVWRGVSYPMDYANVVLVVSDGADWYRWPTMAAFSPARIGYPILGQSGVLQYFDADFLGLGRTVSIRANGSFTGVAFP